MILDKIRQSLGYRFPPLGKNLQSAVVCCLPKTVESMLHPGIHVTLDLRDETQRSTWWKGLRFEHPLGHILCEWGSEPGAVFFDIGSNYGFFSLMLLARNPTLQAYAFEPNPKTFAHLQHTKIRNSLDRLQIWNVGISDQKGCLSLRCGAADSGHSTFGAHPGLDPNSAVMVDVVTFDEWLQERGMPCPTSPQWIAKIDVEGFELRVLRGMEAALRTQVFRGIAIEINPFTLQLTGDRQEEIYELLGSCGYEPKKGFNSAQSGNAFFEPSQKQN